MCLLCNKCISVLSEYRPILSDIPTSNLILVEILGIKSFFVCLFVCAVNNRPIYFISTLVLLTLTNCKPVFKDLTAVEDI